MVYLTMLKIPKNTTVEHGTLSMYAYGCRCHTCKSARKRLNTNTKVGHGNNTMYSYGCRCSSCAQAHRDYDHIYYRKNYEIIRQRRVKHAVHMRKLKDAPCVDCGERYPHYVMDFDHVRGKKRRAVSNMGSCSLQQIDLEAAKCDLVCANCHRERSHKRQPDNL